MLRAIALALSLVASTARAESPPAGTWHLIAIDGKIAPADATLVFQGDNISGKAPCNSWSVTNAATFPALKLTAIRATRRACDQMAEETRFFDSLGAMQTAAVEDETHLILRGPDGRTMEFSTFAFKAVPNCRTCPHIRWEGDAPAP